MFEVDELNSPQCRERAHAKGHLAPRSRGRSTRGRALMAAVCLLTTACSDYQFHGPKDVEPDGPPTEEAAPAIRLSPDPVDFGTLTEATTATRQVTIENPGDADLSLSAVRVDGPSVFSVTLPERTTVPAGAQTTVVVSYAPTEASAAHEARLDVSSSAPDRPTASVSLLGAIDQPSLDSGEPGPDEGPVCACPDGFAPTEDETSCVRETETPAIPTGEVVDVCAIDPYPDYGMYGVRYPGGMTVESLYWGQNDGVENGRLNSVGVWGCASGGSTEAGHDPIGSWIGFSVCLEVSVDGDYLLGLGGDNRVRFAVDGVQIMEQTNDDTQNFKYWWMHTISLTAGTHVVDVEGYNAGVIAAFGAELAGPFAAGSLTNDNAMHAVDYAGTIIWDTDDAIGNAFPIGDSVSWSCPDGTIQEGCGEPTCIVREEEPCL